MTEKEYLDDALSSQKFISGNYNIWAGECVCEPLRNAMLNILDEEHNIQNQIFDEMSSKGWYQVKPANPQEVQTLKDKFKPNYQNQ